MRLAVVKPIQKAGLPNICGDYREFELLAHDGATLPIYLSTIFTIWEVDHVDGIVEIILLGHFLSDASTTQVIQTHLSNHIRAVFSERYGSPRQLEIRFLRLLFYFLGLSRPQNGPEVHPLPADVTESLEERDVFVTLDEPDEWSVEVL